MTTQKKVGIPYTPFPVNLQALEREKSRLLLEAHQLKAQKDLIEAAKRFAQAARYEEELAEWAMDQGFHDLHYLHAFSALSCWAQAGDPHRALEISQRLLKSDRLSEPQNVQLQAYYDALEQRWVSWMQEWVQPTFASA